MSARGLTLGLCATLALVTAVLGAAGHAQAPARARIAVELVELRNDRGRVGCLLFASARGFPTEIARAVARAGSAPASRRATCVFDDLAPSFAKAD